MNIFALQSDPILAARDNCDIHTNSQFKEIAQMLASCFTPEHLLDAPLTQKGKPRKQGYFNHPVTKWIRTSKENTRWAIKHAWALEEERRKIGYNPHFSSCFIQWVEHNLEHSSVSDGPLTDFAVAISGDKLCVKDPAFSAATSIEKYRLFYRYDKPFAKWTNRPVPDWFV